MRKSQGAGSPGVSPEGPRQGPFFRSERNFVYIPHCCGGLFFTKTYLQEVPHNVNV